MNKFAGINLLHDELRCMKLKSSPTSLHVSHILKLLDVCCFSMDEGLNSEREAQGNNIKIYNNV